MKKTTLLLAISCSIGITHLAYANQHEEGKSMDSGKCEGMSHGSFSISGLDLNKDSIISKSEYLEGYKSNSEKIFKHIDANSDGKLDQSEQTDIEAVYKAIHKDYMSKNINI
jgi:hypothetical protein